MVDIPQMESLGFLASCLKLLYNHSTWDNNLCI